MITQLSANILKCMKRNAFFCVFQQVGITIHETLHALGLNHEQLRWDRDDYIAVQWDNINPKLYDAFAIADMKQFTRLDIIYKIIFV